MNYIFLREITDLERDARTALIDKEIESLPFSLANPVKMLYGQLNEQNYDKAMSLSIEFLEISVQWLSMLLLARLIAHDNRSATSAERLRRVVSKIDTKRPLSFGDWLNDIFIPLVAAATQEFPDDKLVASLNTHLFKRKVCLLLGDKREPSVVKIRNEYKGHGTTLSQNIYRDVVYTLEPHIISMLMALEPLCEGGYHSAYSSGENRRFTLSHTGAEVNSGVEGETPLKDNHYYVTLPVGGGVMQYDLFPLIYCTDEGYVYIFQTLGEDNISYVSSNVDAVRLHHDLYNDDFDRLLQRIDSSFDISREMNWEELQVAMADESKRYLERIYNEKKYNKELFVDHHHLSALLEEFYNSDYAMLPLLGEAGQGKTNQLCYWTEQHIQRRDGVLIFNSSDFAVMSLEDRLRKLFGYSPKRDIRKIVDMLHDRAKVSGQRVYIFFDALNECLSYAGNVSGEGPLALYEDIHRIFGEAHYTNFKVVFTCRSYTWKSLFSVVMERDKELLYVGEDESLSTVRGFSAEELERAYAVYQDLYQMGTPFEELSPMACVRLKDPLVLKIASVNYLNHMLPSDIHSYASITLFNRMFRDIEGSYAGRKQCQILLHIGAYILSSYERGEAIDSIPESLLRSAYDDVESPLHELAHLMYNDDGTTIAYGELINKPERPILRLVDVVGRDSKSLQFIYERFLEYVMARIFVERHRLGLASYVAISPSVYVHSLTAAATNVVFMGAMRNAMIMDLLHTGDYSTILAIVRDYSDNYEVTSVVTDVCNILIRENYESEIFALISNMLDAKIENNDEVTRELNALMKTIDSGKADSSIIARHRELHAMVEPIMRLRQMALVNTFNGLLLTDYFAQALYQQQPLELVWRLLCDPIKEVGDSASLYVYYLTNRHYTLEYTPLKENLTERIVREMYTAIKSKSLLKNAVVARYRSRMVVFLESAVRISMLLIIDALLSQKPDARERVAEMLADIRDIMRYMTGGWTLVRIFLPFLQLIMRTQITFQKIYVNNAIEYQGFWDDGVVPRNAEGDRWSRESLRDSLKFIGYAVAPESEHKALEEAFRAFYPTLSSCYELGDSFSYFVAERLLVMMGARRWENVRELYAERLFAVSHRSEWCDYSQMSLLYSLFQIGLHLDFNRELLDIYAHEAEDWTLRCRGQFKARNSHKANPQGYYKRNVMDWYSALYCAHSGDNKPLEGDSRCVPLFYNLIDKAIDTRDKELLFHLIENISELITDFGYVHTGLDLTCHILTRIDSVEQLKEIDDVVVERDGIYRSDTVSVVGNMLSTIKNYYPDAVDAFLKRDIAGLNFPGISQYREDILNYNPSGESLSDLITHKFGKFVIWSLMNEPLVNAFAQQAVDGAVDAKSCFEWYDKTVRLAFRELFDLRV